MVFNFSVDRPKKIKRAEDKGEDAPAVSKDGILVICDGTGATGMSEHEYNGRVLTSAYLGSRKTSELTEAFLSENYESLMDAFDKPEELKALISGLGETIQKGLREFVKENDLKLTVRGKTYRLLPTTLAAAVYKVYDDHIDVIALSAGDSRVLMWEEENGLQQLSKDDVESGYDAFSDVSNTNNCISADNDVRINYVLHTLPFTKCILFATSDGFTDPIKPFDQERCLIQWIGNCKCVLDPENSVLSEDIGNMLDNDRAAGFTGKDDCSIAGAIIGYETDKELKDSLLKRFNYVVETFFKPYRDLERKCREAMDAYNKSNSEKRRLIEQTKNKIVENLKKSSFLLLPSTFEKQQHSTEFLAVTDFLSLEPHINDEIQKIHDEDVEKEQKAKDDYIKANKDLQDAFVEFFQMYCKTLAENGKYDTDLPYEIKSAFDKSIAADKNKEALVKAYNDVLRKIKNQRDINFNTASWPTVEVITPLCTDLVNITTELNKMKADLEESEKVVKNFFSPNNPQIIEIFERRKNTGFVEIDKNIESLKPGFMRKVAAVVSSKDSDFGYSKLRRSKDGFDTMVGKVKQLKSESESPKNKTSEAERERRYNAVINKNIEALLAVVMQAEDPIVFAYFAGMKKTDYEAKLASIGQSADEAKNLIELKSELWKKYKPGYELFANAEKDFILVKKSSEG